MIVFCFWEWEVDSRQYFAFGRIRNIRQKGERGPITISVHLSVKCLLFFVTLGVVFKDQQYHLDFPLTTQVCIQALHHMDCCLKGYMEQFSTLLLLYFLVILDLIDYITYLSTSYFYLISKMLGVCTKNLHLESPQLGPQLKEKKNPAPLFLVW